MRAGYLSACTRKRRRRVIHEPPPRHSAARGKPAPPLARGAHPLGGQRRRSPRGQAASGPARALRALELALKIKTAGYNVYLAGEADLGRTYMLRDFLVPRARREATPPDLLYVNNFEDEDRPLLLRLPAGQGRQLKSAMSVPFRLSARNFPDVSRPIPM